MIKWRIGKLGISRVDKGIIRLHLGEEQIEVLTEDLAAAIRSELPADRAEKMLSETEERVVSKGDVMVQVKSHTNIRKGESIQFKFNVTRYLDSINGQFVGVRADKFNYTF